MAQAALVSKQVHTNKVIVRMSDAILLKRINEGDESALVELHAQYVNLVYSVAHRVLHQDQDAEEATQDVFMRLWEKSETFDVSKGSFTTWLVTITRRIAIDRLRKRERRTKNVDMSMDEQPYLWETLLVQDDMSELQSSLLSAMGELPPEQQEVIQLAYFQGMTHREIAATLQRPLGTVKTHIRTGMEQLRSIWMKASGR